MQGQARTPHQPHGREICFLCTSAGSGQGLREGAGRRGSHCHWQRAWLALSQSHRPLRGSFTLSGEPEIPKCKVWSRGRLSLCSPSSSLGSLIKIVSQVRLHRHLPAKREWGDLRIDTEQLQYYDAIMGLGAQPKDPRPVFFFRGGPRISLGKQHGNGDQKREGGMPPDDTGIPENGTLCATGKGRTHSGDGRGPVSPAFLLPIPPVPAPTVQG